MALVRIIRGGVVVGTVDEGTQTYQGEAAKPGTTFEPIGSVERLLNTSAAREVEADLRRNNITRSTAKTRLLALGVPAATAETFLTNLGFPLSMGPIGMDLEESGAGVGAGAGGAAAAAAAQATGGTGPPYDPLDVYPGAEGERPAAGGADAAAAAQATGGAVPLDVYPGAEGERPAAGGADAAAERQRQWDEQKARLAKLVVDIADGKYGPADSRDEDTILRLLQSIMGNSAVEAKAFYDDTITKAVSTVYKAPDRDPAVVPVAVPGPGPGPVGDPAPVYGLDPSSVLAFTPRPEAGPGVVPMERAELFGTQPWADVQRRVLANRYGALATPLQERAQENIWSQFRGRDPLLAFLHPEQTPEQRFGTFADSPMGAQQLTEGLTKLRGLAGEQAEHFLDYVPDYQQAAQLGLQAGFADVNPRLRNRAIANRLKYLDVRMAQNPDLYPGAEAWQELGTSVQDRAGALSKQIELFRQQGFMPRSAETGDIARFPSR